MHYSGFANDNGPISLGVEIIGIQTVITSCVSVKMIIITMPWSILA